MPGYAVVSVWGRHLHWELGLRLEDARLVASRHRSEGRAAVSVDCRHWFDRPPPFWTVDRYLRACSAN